ncbi:MAG: site-specific integrase [Bacteroidota bacterium]
MSDSFAILFYLRGGRLDKAGRCSLFVRITVDKQRSEISLKRKVHPDQWDSRFGKMKGTKPSTKEFNRFLEDIRTRLFQIQGGYMREGRYYTAAIIRNEFLGKDKKQRTLLKLYDEHNGEIEVLVGKEYSLGAYQRHLRTRKHLMRFIQKEYQRADFPLHEIDLRFIKRFEHYLKVLNIGGRNTVTKYIVNFKKIVRIAHAHDWISRDPFFHWKASWEAVEREALAERELEVLMQKQFDIERLNQVRDIFLFCCFTGLSYSDVKKLSADHIVWNIKGNPIIKTQRTKTNTKCTVPLLPPAQSILSKYEDFQENHPKKLLLPVISNQKLNAYLKEIADVSGINKRLTFHLSRHTFATTVTLANGVPIESVSRMLGHQSLRTTQIYAKVLDKKLVEDMEVLRGKFG